MQEYAPDSRLDLVPPLLPAAGECARRILLFALTRLRFLRLATACDPMVVNGPPLNLPARAQNGTPLDLRLFDATVDGRNPAPSKKPWNVTPL